MSGDQYATKDAAYAAGVRDGLAHADGERQASRPKHRRSAQTKSEGLTIQDLKRMTREEINSRWDEVASVLERA